MGANVTYGSIAVGAYFAHLRGTLQPAFLDQYYPNWDRGGGRGPRTQRDPINWAACWPTSRFTGGAGMGGTDAMSVVGNSIGDSGMFEPFSCDGPGQQSHKFIKGRCVDTSDAALSGVNVQAHRASDGAPAGYIVQSKTDGSYDAPTPYAGVNHFIKAYLTGAPDRAGTTVETLVPTNIDGT